MTPSSPIQASATAPASAWDGYDAYLFDIDGTLLRDPGRVHFLAFAQCLRETLGHEVSLTGIPIHGSTDTAILRDALRQAGVPDSKWLHREPEILDRLAAIVLEQKSNFAVTVMPGVPRILTHLRQRQAALGVATGNLEAIGWLKLEVAGLRNFFTFGGFSDSFPLRSDMIANAVAVAKAQAGTAARICVVGDTPADIAAARANALPTIAVATGIFSLQQLGEHQPEFCVPSLETLLPPTAGV